MYISRCSRDVDDVHTHYTTYYVPTSLGSPHPTRTQSFLISVTLSPRKKVKIFLSPFTKERERERANTEIAYGFPCNCVLKTATPILPTYITKAKVDPPVHRMYHGRGVVPRSERVLMMPRNHDNWTQERNIKLQNRAHVSTLRHFSTSFSLVIRGHRSDSRVSLPHHPYICM